MPTEISEFDACDDRILTELQRDARITMAELGRRVHLSQPAVTEQGAGVGGPWLTVRLPGSTRIRLTLTLTMRTRPPSYATPFGSGPAVTG